MTLLVVGSVAYDTVKTPSGEVEGALGGSATYFAAAASFFAPVRVVAAVGEDFSKEELAFLEKRGVDLSGLETMAGKTFRWTGVYSNDLNERETICTQPNVFEHFQPNLSEEYCRTPFLFLANIDPDLQEQILSQMRTSKLTMSNTIALWIERKRARFLKTLDRVDVLMINDSEARTLAGESDLIKAGRRLLAYGPEVVLITKGEHGVLMVTRDSIFAAPAYPKEEVCDPTGAGDSFAGGFMGCLAQAGALNVSTYRRATVYGSIMASFTIESFSVERLKVLTRDEIEGRYREFVDLTRFHQGE
ncbi:MAG: PfkB family carbohydrate kinase [bacterium]